MSVLTDKEIKAILNEVNEEESKIERDGDEITINYEDAYEIETIWLRKWQNEYGVTFYDLELEYAHRNEEIHNCYSCHDAFCDDCPLKEIKDEIDNYIEKEINEYLKKPKIKIEVFDKLTIERIIVERKCYVDVPHYHIYKGVRVRFETQDFSHVIAILKLRDLLYKLI